MIQQTAGIKAHLRIKHRLSMAIILLAWTLTGVAQTHSDLLIVVDEDGVGYTAQQTLLAGDELIVSRLPAGRNTLNTVFSDSIRNVYRRAHESDPDKLTLSSGSVFTRFRHRFSSETDTQQDNSDPAEVPVLLATLEGFNITMASQQSLTFRVSWILPPNLELLSYAADNISIPEAVGNWRQEDNVITFEQTGAAPAKLSLEFRVHASSNSRANACVASLGPSEWCSPDIDRDGVPDYRDLCIPEDIDEGEATDAQAVILNDNGAGFARPDITPRAKSADALGCDDDALIILSQIQFESGQTYLNAQARISLDKVAIALQRQPDNLFRIAAHTDNVGYIRNNQALSENRADAIRHYLMLRGLGPNQVQARGYGETSPAHDNRTAAGRRANRRVELIRLN